MELLQQAPQGAGELGCRGDMLGTVCVTIDPEDIDALRVLSQEFAERAESPSEEVRETRGAMARALTQLADAVEPGESFVIGVYAADAKDVPPEAMAFAEAMREHGRFLGLTAPRLGEPGVVNLEYAQEAFWAVREAAACVPG